MVERHPYKVDVIGSSPVFPTKSFLRRGHMKPLPHTGQPIKSAINFAPSEPFQSESACILPFLATDISSDGHYALCCEADRPQANTQGLGMSKWFMGPEMNSARNLIRAGAVPLECKSCFIKEGRGEESMRLRIWRYFNEGHYGPGENLVTSPELRLLMYRFGNSCNLSCLMCNANASSTYGEEARQLSEGSWSVHSNPVDLSDAELAKLRVLYLGGGEPSMSKECNSLLDRICAVKNTELTVVLNTNGTLPHSPFFRKLTQFKFVLVGYSIDGFGDSYNLIRYPMKWDKLERNIQTMFNNYPQFNFEIWFTLNNLNLSSIPSFLHWWLELCEGSPTGHVQLNFSEVKAPEFLRPDLCAPDEIQRVKRLVLSLLSDERVQQNSEKLKSVREIALKLSLLNTNENAKRLLTERDQFVEKRMCYRAQTQGG